MAEQEQQDAETDAYNNLVAAGGRPSHPLQLLRGITFELGEYRDIVPFWQDHPDQGQQLFTKQWKHWQEFQAYQLTKRETWEIFKEYVDNVDANLTRHGFAFPRTVKSASASFCFHPSDQDNLVTWIELLHYEYTQIDELETKIFFERHDYWRAYCILLKSGMFEPEEMNTDVVAKLCNQSIFQATQSRCKLDSVSWTVAERERFDRRTQCITRFMEDSRPYRSALEGVELHNLLVCWTRKQVAILEKEATENSLAMPEQAQPPTSSTDEEPPTFKFMQLPPELRMKIWLEQLPVHSTAHFFQVLNYPNPLHMRHHWSAKEFRVCPSKAHSSGYQPVYSLRATCPEAQKVATTAYNRTPGTDLFSELTFDWIPAGDLIVLCLPPKQADLERARALTFTQGSPRCVGILMPKVILLMQRDDFENTEVRLSLLPDFLESFRKGRQGQNKDSEVGSNKGGVKGVYLIVEGLHARDGWNEPFYWGFDSSPKKGFGSLTNKSHSSLTSQRLVWSVGLSGREGLAAFAEGDFIAREWRSKIEQLASMIDRACQDRGWPEYEGMGILGWVG